jgi:ribosomal protein S18 acetylase RimI-like enzyme
VALLCQIGQLHRELRPDIFRPTTLKYDEEQILQILRDEKRPVFVAVQGERVLGFAFCMVKSVRNNSMFVDMDEFYIDDFCVDETCRSQGIGQALYRYIYDYAKERNFRAVTLNVWDCNERAIKFYKKLGLLPQRYFMEAVLGE